MTLRAELAQVPQRRAVLAALNQQAGNQAQQALSPIFSGATRLLSSVLTNNPEASWMEISQRPEIVHFWSQARNQFAEEMVAQFDATQAASEALSRQMVADQMGIDPADVVVDSTYYDAARERMEMRMSQFLTPDSLQSAYDAAEMPQSYHEGGQSTNVTMDLARERADRVQERAAAQARELRRRTQMGLASANQRAYTDSLRATEAQRSRPRRFMWVAQFVDNTPCGTCAALHGTMVGPEQNFSSTMSHDPHPPAVFGGPLTGPPRHPNCRCVLVPVDDDEDAVAPPAPNPVLPKVITAQEIREMHPSAFASFLEGLRSIFRWSSRAWKRLLGGK